ncbi:hypothetical protein SAMN05444395_10214 [Flavobacterium fryxellicola]|uniref:Uncharacterized protein n=1 Tax=Flavobacterium fryxellicola TaxID=249352 RepID=A0A167YAU1_9FLAO|nr:hypothetical protein [Flavobacterium fryxellicola]OAB29195.1 hypothetical protein FBFR_07085 [Flavobacterium fryxellicola]SHN57635.1 hypothetical protein SAMN05444395_10214 [Flavobacterium fryxellicola]
MKFPPFLLLISVLLLNCENKDNQAPKRPVAKKTDTLHNIEESNQKKTDSVNTIQTQQPHQLILTSNALQAINKTTGSTSEIPFGKPFDEMNKIVTTILQSKPMVVGINAECGAGPLKMASWNNGLTLVFQKKEVQSVETESRWEFAGWYVSLNSGNTTKITTMAGIGIGSTRGEMESAYVIIVKKSSLGYEFSTTSGLFGIFDGMGKQAKITNIWSGVSCNFR